MYTEPTGSSEHWLIKHAWIYETDLWRCVHSTDSIMWTTLIYCFVTLIYETLTYEHSCTESAMPCKHWHMHWHGLMKQWTVNVCCTEPGVYSVVRLIVPFITGWSWLLLVLLHCFGYCPFPCLPISILWTIYKHYFMLKCRILFHETVNIDVPSWAGDDKALTIYNKLCYIYAMTLCFFPKRLFHHAWIYC